MENLQLFSQTSDFPYTVSSKQFGTPNTNGIHSLLLCTPYAYNHLRTKKSKLGKNIIFLEKNLVSKLNLKIN